MDTGDRVIATRDIGGIDRPKVRKGTPGVVVKSGVFSRDVVEFEIPAGLVSSAKTVRVEVDTDEIDKA